ncbi:MAG TPA: carbonic anhydrase [Actinomycetota bacterium]|nr:carbonic anhydrase [Actinomycetota bacterium]
MISASEALAKLRQGNERFVAGMQTSDVLITRGHRAELPQTQAPFAIVLGCSDSRVPAEIVFDQGLGDLFVIRVAGNIVAPSQIGSVEYAVERFGTPLVIVLGHSQCGAVLATLEELRRPDAEPAGSLWSIVERIRPAVKHLAAEEITDESLARAVRANIEASVDQLQSGSAMISSMVGDGRLTLTGAEYSIETGSVEFL